MKTKLKQFVQMLKATLPVILISVSFSSTAQWTISGTKIYNSNTGRVGIGITAPATKIQVNGEGRFGSAANYARISSTGTFSLAGSGNYLVSDNSYAFKQVNSGNRGFYINKANNRFELRDSSANDLFHVDYYTGNAYLKKRLALGTSSFGNMDNNLVLGSNGTGDGGGFQLHASTNALPPDLAWYIRTVGNDFVIYKTNIWHTSPFTGTATWKIDSIGRSIFSPNGAFSPDAYLTILGFYPTGNTGAYTSTGWVNSSDARLKTNIRPLENSLEKILKLQGVSFNWVNRPNDNNQVGFIAQDVEIIYPEVIVKGTNGEYAMASQNLVAPVVEAIKERQKQIEEKDEAIKNLEQAVVNLQQVNTFMKSHLESSENALSQCCRNDVPSGQDIAKLEQNNPQPYNGTITIRCYISPKVSEAILKIYSLAGEELKSVAITDKGINELEMTASSLSPGTYNYLLITDGKTIDTKQLILTK